MSFKPGPNTNNYVIVPTNTSAGGGIPAQIMSLSNIGTSGAIATIRELDASGFLTGSQYGGVYIIPYPEFAEVGDRGFYSTYTPTSGTGQTNIRYIQISKQAFQVF